MKILLKAKLCIYVDYPSYALYDFKLKMADGEEISLSSKGTVKLIIPTEDSHVTAWLFDGDDIKSALQSTNSNSVSISGLNYFMPVAVVDKNSTKWLHRTHYIVENSGLPSKFVIKGGMLVAAIVGLDTRSTMDLDTTLKNLNLTEESILRVVKDICEVKIDNEVDFELIGVSEIRKDDRYGGYCVRLNAIYDTIITPLSIDISTGDVITPEPVLYEFGGIFDEEVRIRLWGYNIETVMAEKAETILSRGIFNTRPRDYYDILYTCNNTKI